MGSTATCSKVSIENVAQSQHKSNDTAFQQIIVNIPIKIQQILVNTSFKISSELAIRYCEKPLHFQTAQGSAYTYTRQPRCLESIADSRLLP